MMNIEQFKENILTKISELENSSQNQNKKEHFFKLKEVQEQIAKENTKIEDAVNNKDFDLAAELKVSLAKSESKEQLLLYKVKELNKSCEFDDDDLYQLEKECVNYYKKQRDELLVNQLIILENLIENIYMIENIRKEISTFISSNIISKLSEKDYYNCNLPNVNMHIDTVEINQQIRELKNIHGC